MTDENLTRSEIINTYGEDLGNKLIDAGFSSLSNLMSVEDELLEEREFTAEEIAVIREALDVDPVEPVEETEEVEEDGLEEEAPAEAQDEEAAGDLPEEDSDTPESPEVLPEESPEPAVVPDAIPEAPEGPQQSVRVRRIAEAEAQKTEINPPTPITEDFDAPEIPPGSEDLGSVDVDFEPENDSEPEVEAEAEAEAESEEVDSDESE